MKQGFLLLKKSSSVCALLFALTACQTPTSVVQTIKSIQAPSSASVLFASGTKGVKIITGTTAVGGSFTAPAGGIPLSTALIPTTFPGGDGVSTYTPGYAATSFFNLDGTAGSKPSWLLDFQLGLTGIPGTTTCATFGGAGSLDVSGYYRTSEVDCAAAATGTGSGVDPIFARIILDRTQTQIGTAENLLVQIEYQASGLHLNSYGAATLNDSLDQIWKIFWNTTLAGGGAGSPFAIFVPPNYAACIPSGSGTTGAGGASDACAQVNYLGASTKVKQFIIPISAYPTLSVIQLTRVQGRINTATSADVGTFCTSSDSPLCLGVVIRSVTIMRM